MLADLDNFDALVKRFSSKSIIACDTETTGLYPYKGDRLFSIILTDDEGSAYFNFQAYPGIPEKLVLPKKTHLKKLSRVFSGPHQLVFMHGAKFDLGILHVDGIEVPSRVHCTEVTARLLYNAHMKYSLGACCQRIGLKKDDTVEKYIEEHKLYTQELTYTESGKAKKKKNKHYDKVPFELISNYGLRDGDITYALGLSQLVALTENQLSTPGVMKPKMNVYRNDLRLLKTCFAMEEIGFKIDRAYTEKAFEYERSKLGDLKKRFEEISGVAFLSDGTKTLVPAFTAINCEIKKTATGRASFTDEILAGYGNELASVVRSYRKASKIAYTYYQNFLKFADHTDRIHANIRMAGTETGRFSYAEPNLQNVPKKAVGEYAPRRCFVPTNENYCLVMIDYDQMEYRMLVDAAEELQLIERILGGLDVHTATAEMLSLARDNAKTMNFLIIYGGGPQKLADNLSVPLEQAVEYRRQYFSGLPNVKRFSRKIIQAAEQYRKVVNWAGFVCNYPQSSQGYEYAALNHYIQGGCAQVIRRAMPECQDVLAGTRSRLVGQVHDELIFELHKDELDLCHKFKDIMEKSYPAKRLPLTCGISHSWKSWGDKKEGAPC